MIRSSRLLTAFRELLMARTGYCVVLGAEAPGMERVPHPGELGQRIYENVSAEGWQQWIERQTMIINENGLSTIDPASLEILEQHMLGFIFKEGEMGQTPEGFRPPGAKK
jgi:Fe-S cluster biosynthesis and repair protein YggX